MRAFLVFDLDNTLAHTANAFPYLGNSYGRNFVSQNISAIPTFDYDPSVRKVFTDFYQKKAVAVASNSPDAYVRAVLAKHGFPADVPVFAALDKPRPGCMNRVRFSVPQGYGIVVVGDSPKDVLAAHEIQSVSIGAGWGAVSRQRLAAAEPSILLDSPQDLEQMIIEIESERIRYAPRQAPNNFMFAPNASSADIPVHFVSEYYNYDRQGTNDGFSTDIFTFKGSGEVAPQDFFADARDPYFYNGHLRYGKSYKGVVANMLRLYQDKIDELGLADTFMDEGVYFMAAPNSLPEYCYAFDINHAFINFVHSGNVANQIHFQRAFYRVFPKSKDSSGSRSDISEHFRTVGVPRDAFVWDVPNLVIFDDVTTTGRQIKSIAGIMRALGYQGNIYGIALGRAVHMTYDDAHRQARPAFDINDLPDFFDIVDPF